MCLTFTKPYTILISFNACKKNLSKRTSFTFVQLLTYISTNAEEYQLDSQCDYQHITREKSGHFEQFCNSSINEILSFKSNYYYYKGEDESYAMRSTDTTKPYSQRRSSRFSRSRLLIAKLTRSLWTIAKWHKWGTPPSSVVYADGMHPHPFAEGTSVISLVPPSNPNIFIPWMTSSPEPHSKVSCNVNNRSLLYNKEQAKPIIRHT